ncbi:hypothetical protein [Flavobacterium muglaense]|uniref:Uncharacterized protein n=1 Tax=Flavobacterium muglaense TaxID=2764716 RepID=A0A923MY55_9FLAO|nr:hypothetical protein [Flavobacterium muglaense]MBC5836780.1 hypothetical protein [Flavobacterium muglaense]MBC5843270.1 hypothetical protein [Flavobacterium muglaense]
MANERIFINDVEFELTNNSTDFARTLQVNDLISLQSRQTSYTKNIHIPKTPNNLQALGFIGEFNSTGYALPSRKLEVTYIVGNDYMIYKGWGVIEETTDEYISINVYDGLIDLYKSIENVTLSELDVDALEHPKTLTNVINSITNIATSPYTYIVADYGGKARFTFVTGGTSGTSVNMDYLVPSVKVSYLVDKIFDYADATYSGSTFLTTEYEELYISYSNGYPVDAEPIIFYSNTSFQQGTNLGNSSYSAFVVKHNSAAPYSGSFSTDEVYLIPTTGVYQFVDDGVGTGKWDKGIYGQTAFGIRNAMVVEVIVNNGTAYDIKTKPILTLNSNDTIKIIARTSGGYKLNNITFKLNLKYYLIGGNEVNFKNSLKEFQVKDFLNEIIYRYGLTIYKDKYTNHYTFKTFDEIINYDSNNLIDLSNSFVKKINEKYKYGSYAQNNIIKYKYNVDGSSYEDKTITINNVNLEETKIVLTSKMYAKEEFQSKELGYYSNQYLLWTKDLSDGVTTYRSLTNHFHFISLSRLDLNTFIGSELTGDKILINPFYLSKDVYLQPYVKFEGILNDFKLITAEMYFDISQINNFDFSKLYYFKQLGGYYIVNKIQDYQLGKTCKVELIKANY